MLSFQPFVTGFALAVVSDQPGESFRGDGHLWLLKVTWLAEGIAHHSAFVQGRKKGHLITVPAPTGTLFWTLNVNDSFKFVLKSVRDFRDPF